MSDQKKLPPPRVPAAEAVKYFVGAIMVGLAVGYLAMFLGVENRTFYKTLGMVILVFPFFLGKKAWDAAQDNLREYQKRREERD